MKDISIGINLFNDADFFSAHDFFEDCWLNCTQSEKLFYQGMVQISVGCFHLISGNYKGCTSQFRKGIEKLYNFLPVYKGIHIKKLLEEVDEILRFLNDKSSEKIITDLQKIIPKLEIIG